MDKVFTKQELLSSNEYTFYQKDILSTFLREDRMYMKDEIKRLFRITARGISLLVGGEGRKLNKKEQMWFDERFVR